MLASAGEAPVEEQILEAVLLATLITHPALILRHEAELESMDLLTPGHDALRVQMLRLAHDVPSEASATNWRPRRARPLNPSSRAAMCGRHRP